MKAAKDLKLPISLLQDQTALKLKHFMSLLSPQSAFFSCILYQKEGKMFFLKKDNTFPYIPVDWTLYTLMRTNSRTIVTSGKTLRSEKWIYGESRGTFGKEELALLYQQNVAEPFNLIVYSKIMSDDEIRKIICQKYFKLMPLSQIWGLETKTCMRSFKDVAQRINSLKIGPTIYENGEETLKEGFDSVSQNERNFTQMIILSVYQGEMPNKFICKQYDTKILERDFKKVWESPLIHAGVKKEEVDEKNVGSLKFEVYIRSDKADQHLL